MIISCYYSGSIQLFKSLSHRSSRIRKSLPLFILLGICYSVVSAYGAFIASPITELPSIALTDQHGKERTFAGQSDQVKVINFWATWCPPCVRELPTLAALAETFDGLGVQVVLVNEDIQFDKAQEFLKDFDFPASTPHVFDQGGRFMQAVKGRGLPITLIVDQSGQLRHYVQGELDWNATEIHTLLKDIRVHTPSWWQRLLSIF